MKRAAFLLFFLLLLVLVIPLSVDAQIASPQTIGCSGVDCQACNLVRLIQNVIRFIIFVSIPVLGILVAYAGFLYFSSGVSAGNIERARSIFFGALIGFIIMLGAWLIVNLIITSLAGTGFTWNRIECGKTVTSSTLAPGGKVTEKDLPKQDAIPGTGMKCFDKFCQCANCTKIDSDINVKHRGTSDTIDAEYAEGLRSLQTITGIGLQWQITEAYPPTTGIHKDGCHYNGTCTDVALIGVPHNRENIERFQEAAAKSGFCAVFETPGSCPAGVKGCLAGTGTGDHFSLYKAGYAGCTRAGL